jgi:ribosomal protein S18 acetylase RimI-like enzyme
VIIQPARPENLPDIARLAGVVWRGHYPGIISSDQIEYMLARMYDVNVMREELERGIAYDQLLADDELVAFACYGPESSAEMKLYKLYVHPHQQRHGFGSQLLSHVENISRSRGFTSVCLTVNKRNEKAIAAYRKNGFVIRDSIVVDIGGGFVMDDYVMAKRL